MSKWIPASQPPEGRGPGLPSRPVLVLIHSKGVPVVVGKFTMGKWYFDEDFYMAVIDFDPRPPMQILNEVMGWADFPEMEEV